MKKAKLALPSQPSKSSNDDKVRIFIDPASISTGWALFKGPKLVAHGTVAVDRKLPIFKRLSAVYRQYAQSKINVEEVHIEQLVRNTHIFTHWSVAVIGLAFTDRCASVEADIPIQSWQAHVRWKTDQAPLSAFKGSVHSEDELAAIGMGLYYTEKKI